LIIKKSRFCSLEALLLQSAKKLKRRQSNETDLDEQPAPPEPPAISATYFQTVPFEQPPPFTVLLRQHFAALPRWSPKLLSMAVAGAASACIAAILRSRGGKPAAVAAAVAAAGRRLWLAVCGALIRCRPGLPPPLVAAAAAALSAVRLRIAAASAAGAAGFSRVWRSAVWVRPATHCRVPHHGAYFDLPHPS
jgi:hypothetical protein